MPSGRYPPGVTHGDWDIRKREDGWWLLLRELETGEWRDYSGPYRQRGSALARYRRMEFYELMAIRHDPAHVHTFRADGPEAYRRRCTGCLLYVEEEEASE